MTKTVIKLRAGDYYIPTTTWREKDRIFFKFPFNRILLNEIKAMEARKWHPEIKTWSVLDTLRNRFALAYLVQGQDDPYEHFDKPLSTVTVDRPLWKHQHKMLGFFLARQYCLLAAEQGTGKSLPLIELMERTGFSGNDIWYVSTTSGLEAMRLELENWDSDMRPQMLTFEAIKKPFNADMKGYNVPKLLIGDESSRLKTPTSLRSRAFKYVADQVRDSWGWDGYVVLCTGTPAPHSPVDWWMQCEITCPGFIKESSPKIFKDTLAMVEYVDRDGGISYPQIITWWDNENKCGKCGSIPDKIPCDRHDCRYVKSVNELQRFHERAAGLVLDMKKEDCLDLPDKYYKTVRCKVSKEVKNLAAAIVEDKETKIEALSALRCLSDGHQYYEEEVGVVPCPICKGEGIAEDYLVEEEIYEEFEVMAEAVEGTCWKCLGEGTIPKLKRTYAEIDSPKLDKVSEILEEYEDVGRVIIYAAYHASIDRISKLCLSKKWIVMKVDGRGWFGTTPSGDVIHKRDMIKMFQQKPSERTEATRNIVWVAHPESSGTGLTLTQSPVEVFYSNSFKADDRLQAEDRAHRPGMDMNKGLTVIDIIHLETDELIFDNLSNKRWLQDLTMGRIKDKLCLTEKTHTNL